MARRRPHHGSRRRGSGRAPARPRATVQGTLRVVRPGMAVVETSEGTFDVARRGMREAMNGDEVQVSLVEPHGRRAGQPGRKLAYVQLVLERRTQTFLGTFSWAGPLGAVRPLDARLGHDFYVVPEDATPGRLGVGEGDVVVARIVEYPARRSAPVVTLERRVGSASELDVNVEAVIASYGLATEFPPAALGQVRDLEPRVDEALAAEPSRADLRDRLCVTIDPADARDFDDAVGARTLPNGGFELMVHIADVTHYVGWDTPVDDEAKRRTCSAYLVDRVLPMLPERLCNDVCSLRPGEDRLAMTVTMRLDARGHVRSAEATRSAIRSASRLSYDEADALLEGRIGPGGLPCEAAVAPAVAELLRTLDRIRGLRERVRHERGALDFDTAEARVTLDGDGRPTGVSVRRRTHATGCVEEAMLLANESVARMLADAEVPTAFRVHERPAPDDLRATVQPLRELGLLDGPTAERLVAGEPGALQDVLAAAKGTRGEYAANALLLRAQKRAVYLPHNDGHYALGAAAYCHFTSPIRRYPDQLVHRALKALLDGTTESRAMARMEARLPQLCSACSQMERTADAASRASQKVKMAELYAGRVGERAMGTVTGVERYGVFVMLDGTCAEGLLPSRALDGNWLEYDDARMTLTDSASGRVWGLGMRIEVQVAGANPARGQIDFVPAGRLAPQEP